MRLILPIAAIVLPGVCGKSDEKALEDAANQSDRADDAVLGKR